MIDSFPSGLRVSFVIGVIVRRDAISNICLQQVEALTQFARRQGFPVAIRVYTTGSQHTDSRITIIADVASLIADEHFIESDVIVYHFGIYTALFDSIHFVPSFVKKIVYFHGITPPMLVHDKQREVLVQSYQQAVNLHVADQILVTSKFLMRELARMGMPVSKMVQTPPAISFTVSEHAVKPRMLDDSGLRLVYIGRFVRAKGVLDLLHAVYAFRKKTNQGLQLDLVGSKTFSDAAYMSVLEQYASEAKLADSCRFHYDASTSELVQLLKRAHALVIPSYHEGFCVPVLEAYTCACFVICADAGALPETAGNIGRTYDMANVDMLSGRLDEFVAARRQDTFRTDGGVLTSDEWAAKALAHVATLSAAGSDQQFCKAVVSGIRQIDPSMRNALATRRRQLLLEMLREPLTAPACNSLEATLCRLINFDDCVDAA